MTAPDSLSAFCILYRLDRWNRGVFASKPQTRSCLDFIMSHWGTEQNVPLLLDQGDSVSNRLREDVLHLCTDNVINLSWCWKWGSDQDLVYLSVPDGYGRQRTPGHRRASPRQRGRPPAEAKLTSPTVSSWERDTGERGAQKDQRGERRRKRAREDIRTSTPKLDRRQNKQTNNIAFWTSRNNVRGEPAEVKEKKWQAREQSKPEENILPAQTHILWVWLTHQQYHYATSRLLRLLGSH